MAKRPTIADVSRTAAKVRKLESEVEAARAKLDALLAATHEDGTSIAELARETGLSRQAIYNALERARAAARAGRFTDGDCVILKPEKSPPAPRRRPPPKGS